MKVRAGSVKIYGTPRDRCATCPITAWNCTEHEASKQLFHYDRGRSITCLDQPIRDIQVSIAMFFFFISVMHSPPFSVPSFLQLTRIRRSRQTVAPLFVSGFVLLDVFHHQEFHHLRMHANDGVVASGGRGSLTSGVSVSCSLLQICLIWDIPFSIQRRHNTQKMASRRTIGQPNVVTWMKDDYARNYIVQQKNIRSMNYCGTTPTLFYQQSVHFGISKCWLMALQTRDFASNIHAYISACNCQWKYVYSVI